MVDVKLIIRNTVKTLPLERITASNMKGYCTEFVTSIVQLASRICFLRNRGTHAERERNEKNHQVPIDNSWKRGRKLVILCTRDTSFFHRRCSGYFYSFILNHSVGQPDVSLLSFIYTVSVSNNNFIYIS